MTKYEFKVSHRCLRTRANVDENERKRFWRVSACSWTIKKVQKSSGHWHVSLIFFHSLAELLLCNFSFLILLSSLTKNFLNFFSNSFKFYVCVQHENMRASFLFFSFLLFFKLLPILLGMIKFLWKIDRISSTLISLKSFKVGINFSLFDDNSHREAQILINVWVKFLESIFDFVTLIEKITSVSMSVYNSKKI